MNRRISGGLAAGALALMLVGAPAALAHHGDSHSDGTSNCDGWARDGHSHDHSSSSDSDLGFGYLHNHGGHYSFSTAAGYVEVIGGQGYNQGGNQGGVLQGEVDDSSVGTDVDFAAWAFAGQSGPLASGGACVNVLDQRIST